MPGPAPAAGARRSTTVRALAIAVLLLAGARLLRGSTRGLRRSWASRVAVDGGSMAPTLRAGDWLLVDPDAYTGGRPRVGELVLVRDPRRVDRLLVKRVARVLPDGAVEVVGDAPWASTDSRSFGAVDATSVAGRPWFRYWPLHRIGPVR